LIWRSGMYFEQGQCKAFVSTDLQANVLTMAVRGISRKQCMAVMEDITNQAIQSASIYPSLTFHQKARSPFSSEHFIDLEACLAESNNPNDKRTLKCPRTRNPIDPDKVLLAAGMIDEISDDKEKYWWAFDLHKPNWVSHGTINEYRTCEFIRDGQIIDSEYVNKLTSLVSVNVRDIKYAYALHNSLLSGGFEYYQKALLGKLAAKEKLFKKDDWQAMEKKVLRQAFLDILRAHTSKYQWLNYNHIQAPVVPMFQGSREDNIWSICQNGFTTVATLDDGFYGKGVYFTSDFDYAMKYAVRGASKFVPEEGKTPKGNGILVALTIPGNTFPVIEHPFEDYNGVITKDVKGEIIPNPKGFYGRGVKGGYQSHYTIVSKSNIQDAYPIKEAYNPEKHADELVVFQDAQALPVFALFF